jgi:hypothetical protein
MMQGTLISAIPQRCIIDMSEVKWIMVIEKDVKSTKSDIYKQAY